MRHIGYLALISLVLFSCQDRANIVVTGEITDESTGQPIANAEVVVLCWSMTGLDDASFKKQTLFTDKNGRYKAAFPKGHQVDVASKAKQYQPGRSYNELKDNELEVNIKLSKSRNNQTLVALLNTDINSFDTTNKVPSIKIRIYSKKDGKALDLNNVETYGFDMTTLTTKTDTTECDFWFKLERREAHPTLIRANLKGGILPVNGDEINSSFFYEKTIAPTTGYKTQHLLTGEEDGFFVLCRDGKTFGKIILEKSIIDISSPDGKGGHYKEFVKIFSCLYQPNGTTDLSYSQIDIDLEDFLVITE